MAGIFLNTEVQTRSVSVEDWLALAKTGDVMPIKIKLSGQSMQPLIRYNRDYVTVIPMKREPLKGDVVIFFDAYGRYCAHRIKAINGDCVKTLGDNCPADDGWIKKSDIIGLIIRLERDGKSYNLDSDLFRFYGKVRMVLLPLRLLKRKLIQLLWSAYVRLFKNGGGKNGE